MTTGEQVKKFLYTLYPNMMPEDWDGLWTRYFQFNKDNTQLAIRVSEIGTCDKLIEAISVSGINPMFLHIDLMWGHLTITVCDYDKNSKFDFSTDYENK